MLPLCIDWHEKHEKVGASLIWSQVSDPKLWNESLIGELSGVERVSSSSWWLIAPVSPVIGARSVAPATAAATQIHKPLEAILTPVPIDTSNRQEQQCATLVNLVKPGLGLSLQP